MSTQRILGTVIGAILFAVALSVALSFLLSWPVMALWNGCLVPAVQGINEVTWLQAWGLSLLFSFLFKSHVGTKD